MVNDNPSPEAFEQRLKEGIAAEHLPDETLIDTPLPEETPSIEAEHLAEIAALQDKVLRMAAEMQNLRHRTEKEISEARKYGITGFSRDLITVLEHLHLALVSIPTDKIEADPLFKNLLDGVKLTADELENVFKRHGLNRISPVGEKFNHNFHQAMIEIPTNDVETGHIVQVMQAGYLLHDRLIRPALVGVAKALPTTTEETENQHHA